MRFNDEFLPSWRPSYLVHEAPTASPQAFVGVLQAEGNLPELRQLRRPRETALPQTVAGFVRDGAATDGARFAALQESGIVGPVMAARR